MARLDLGYELFGRNLVGWNGRRVGEGLFVECDGGLLVLLNVAGCSPQRPCDDTTSTIVRITLDTLHHGHLFQPIQSRIELYNVAAALRR